MIARQTVEYVVKTIAKRYNPERIILFGSCASGDAANAHDLDLFIIKDTATPRYKRARELHEYFADDYPCAMDLIVYTPAEVEYWRDCKFSFVHRVLKTGKVVYGRSKARTGAALDRESGE